jgi:hypothetical protein
MSSHHFVRAEQADCLIVVNNHIQPDLFAQLLEWNPIIVATESSLEWLTSQDIKVDVLLTNQTNIDFPYPVQLLPILNVFEAIEYFENTLKVEGISIVGDSDTQPYLDFMLKKGNKNMVMMESDAKYFLLMNGDQFKKHMFVGEEWQYYPEKRFQTNANLEYFFNGFKVLKEEIVVIHATGNFIFKELV